MTKLNIFETAYFLLYVLSLIAASMLHETFLNNQALTRG